MVRADLPHGAQAAQLIHAAGESSPGHLPPHTFAIALAAPNESALLMLEERLKVAGIPHAAIREPDAPYLNALMAIGIRPMARAPLRRLLSRFALVK